MSYDAGWPTLLRKGPSAIGREIEREETLRDTRIRERNYLNNLQNRQHVTIQGAHTQSEHIEQTPDKQGFALPGTKYTGPGNSLNRGTGVNQADEDARIHDEEYNVAGSHKDIQKSDIHLLSRAGDHIAEGISGKGSIGDTLLAAAQGIGIGTKYLAEKAVGPIYPNTFTGKYGTSKILLSRQNESLCFI